MTVRRWNRHDLGVTRRGGIAAVALAVAALSACSSEPERPESPVDDTSATTSSDEVSADAEAADGHGAPDPDRFDPATVVFDGTPLLVAAVTCEHGPEFTAQLEDGGDLRVATEEDGTLSVQIVVPRDGASQAWATEAEEAGEGLELMFYPERVEGAATLTPVDQDGAADATRDDVEVRFDLACDA